MDYHILYHIAIVPVVYLEEKFKSRAKNTMIN